MRNGVRVALIAAVAENGVIGDRSGLPWRLSTDMKRFRHLTLGKPVIMGRKTFETLPSPLDGRLNIVVTKQPVYRPEGAIVTSSLDEALSAAAVATTAEIMVIGGGEVYEAAIDYADRLYITHVAAHPDGDTVFPRIDSKRWKAAKEEVVPTGERDSAPTRFVIYDRVGEPLG